MSRDTRAAPLPPRGGGADAKPVVRAREGDAAAFEAVVLAELKQCRLLRLH
ncbi:hypothetical protein KVP10_08735 [Candidimonas humi]|uniref:GNAT family N-acetyltransferase n=1 Tax=Candidimonas humi TaxID=683355 RepID=A0ABV8NYL5_9BURK|nr:hypothetical protein [Candidimonas humi]MBV6304972.1 hypothetical protein [Candidimonas humi]